MSKPQRKFPIDFFSSLGEDPFMVADLDAKPSSPTARVSRERVPAFPEDAPSGGSTYEPSPERRASTRSVFFADNRPAVASPAPERPAPEPVAAPAKQQVILIARSGTDTEGMDALNQAMADGWRVAHIAPVASNGPHFSALVFLERAA